MDGKSKDIKKEQIEKIKQLFPEAVSDEIADIAMCWRIIWI